MIREIYIEYMTGRKCGGYLYLRKNWCEGKNRGGVVACDVEIFEKVRSFHPKLSVKGRWNIWRGLFQPQIQVQQKGVSHGKQHPNASMSFLRI